MKFNPQLMQKLLTAVEAAEQLQVHHQSALKYISHGIQIGQIRIRLKASRFGKTYRIRQEDLDKFIKLTSQF